MYEDSDSEITTCYKSKTNGQMLHHRIFSRNRFTFIILICILTLLVFGFSTLNEIVNNDTFQKKGKTLSVRKTFKI